LNGFLIPYFFRYKKTATKRIEIALLTASLFSGFRQKQETGMIQIGTLVKMPFKRATQKT
jgi:hypothetical protein